MTEADWLACEDPTQMLLFIRGCRTLRRRVKRRKQRLFAAACCRRLGPLLGDERGRRCVEVAERFANGQATAEELRAAEAEARETWLKAAGDDTAFACLQLCASDVDGLHVSTAAVSAVYNRQRADAGQPFDPLGGRRAGSCPSEERAQCVLVRDVFGTPFRPTAAAPEWRTSTVATLATAIDAGRAFDRLPILADALEDAGCDHPGVLAHCRDDGLHTKGCWVIDLLLESE